MEAVKRFGLGLLSYVMFALVFTGAVLEVAFCASAIEWLLRHGPDPANIALMALLLPPGAGMVWLGFRRWIRFVKRRFVKHRELPTLWTMRHRKTP